MLQLPRAHDGDPAEGYRVINPINQHINLKIFVARPVSH